MTARIGIIARRTIRIAAAPVLLTGLFRTWFGIAWECPGYFDRAYKR